MPFSDINDFNTSADFGALEDKIKTLMTEIAAEETRLSKEIQAYIEAIKSISGTTNEMSANDITSTIANLIGQNSNIEQELKDSIKKEMNFQLDFENLLNTAPNSVDSTENPIPD